MKNLQKRFNSFKYNHLFVKAIMDYGFPLLATIFSSAIFVFGLVAFLEPSMLGGGVEGARTMVSGGSSGLAQVIKLILMNIFKISKGRESLIYSLLYVLINAPLLVLAYKGVGKRFAIYTIINVVFVAIFSNIFKGDFFINIATYVSEEGGMLTRALFAGMCTGLSSAIAFKIDSSAGGFDIVSYYISSRKSTLTGKYGILINGTVVTAFALVTAITDPSHNYASAVGGMLFSFVYLLTIMLVIDVINVRNKKVQIQIITTNKDLPKLLITNIPHGATTVDAKGVFTESDRFIIYMVVSATEVKRSVSVIKELDPESFVNVTALQGVYGNFHMKPIK